MFQWYEYSNSVKHFIHSSPPSPPMPPSPQSLPQPQPPPQTIPFSDSIGWHQTINNGICWWTYTEIKEGFFSLQSEAKEMDDANIQIVIQ